MVDTDKELALQKHLAPRIKRSIQEAGLTYEAVADAVDVSKAAVSKWTNTGKIKMANLCELADLVERPLAWYFPGYDVSESDALAGRDVAALRELLSAAADMGDSEFLEDVLFEVLSAKRVLAPQ